MTKSRQKSIKELRKEIKENAQKHNFEDALLLIKEYLTDPKNGVDIELISIYIDCQIKLGLFEEATKNVEIMHKYFIESNPFDLALKYAACCQTEKLKALLATTEFSSEQYCEIAQYCFSNENIELAEELFNLACVSENEKIVNTARKKLRIIDIYKCYGEQVFHDQRCGCFKYHGNRLLPGHVIMTCKLRDEYPENCGYIKTEWPYMIWKIDGEKIYAFPVTKDIDKYRHPLSKDNYPCREDRTLKDRLACILEGDVTNVIDKITDTDYLKSIESMQLSLINTQMGDWTPETSYFMNSFITNKEVEIGDIIVFCKKQTKEIRYYFVFSIDEFGYQTYEVGPRFLPYTDNIQVKNLSKEVPITSIITLSSLPEKKELLLSLAPSLDTNKRVLKPE